MTFWDNSNLGLYESALDDRGPRFEVAADPTAPGAVASFVAKYEAGERRLEVIEFVQICRAIGVLPEQILRKLP